MCEPATISAIVGYVSANATAITAATAVASVAASAYGQQQTARATTQNANDSADAASVQLREQQHQVDQKATEELVARSQQGQLEVGALNAIFADTGLAGNSQGRIINHAEGNAYVDMTTIERNRQAGVSQGAVQAAQIRARQQSQINSAPRPSLIGTGLQIVAAGTDAYTRRTPARAGPG